MPANARHDHTTWDARSVMNYTIRRSPRARHVWLRFTERADLVVVVPKQFDTRRIAGVVEANREWIQRAAIRVEARREALERKSPAVLPEHITLPAVKRGWVVEYRPADSPRVTINERPRGRLVLSGNTAESERCRGALLRWLHRRARESLVPELHALAEASGFSTDHATVRSQRTRWASCSRHGTISLNIRLLFMPPELVRHVMLHELCHTKRMDHSHQFWSLVERHDPHWRNHRTRLRAGWRELPAWLNPEMPVRVLVAGDDSPCAVYETRL